MLDRVKAAKEKVNSGEEGYRWRWSGAKLPGEGTKGKNFIGDLFINWINRITGINEINGINRINGRTVLKGMSGQEVNRLDKK